MAAPRPPAAAQVDHVVDHAAGEVLLGQLRLGGQQVPHGVADRGQDVFRVAGVAGVAGEQPGHLREHLVPWRERSGLEASGDRGAEGPRGRCLRPRQPRRAGRPLEVPSCLDPAPQPLAAALRGHSPITLCRAGWRDMLLSREAPDRTTSELPDCSRRAMCGRPFSFSPISWLMPLDIWTEAPSEDLARGCQAPHAERPPFQRLAPRASPRLPRPPGQPGTRGPVTRLGPLPTGGHTARPLLPLVPALPPYRSHSVLT